MPAECPLMLAANSTTAAKPSASALTTTARTASRSPYAPVPCEWPPPIWQLLWLADEGLPGPGRRGDRGRQRHRLCAGPALCRRRHEDRSRRHPVRRVGGGGGPAAF